MAYAVVRDDDGRVFAGSYVLDDPTNSRHGNMLLLWGDALGYPTKEAAEAAAAELHAQRGLKCSVREV